MRIVTLRPILLLIPLALAGLGAVADAGAGKGGDDQAIAREALRRGEVLPLRRILEAAAARVPGEVVKVELEVEHKRLIYEIKVAGTDDIVRKVRYDARSGACIGVEVDD